MPADLARRDAVDASSCGLSDLQYVSLAGGEGEEEGGEGRKGSGRKEEDVPTSLWMSVAAELI